MIFLFHITLRWSLELPTSISNIIFQGALGMSVFFILSGFVLTYRYFQEQPINDYKNYLVKRVAIIYPVYILASLLTLPWVIISPASSDIFSWLTTALTYALIIGLNLFLLQGWFPSLFN